MAETSMAGMPSFGGATFGSSSSLKGGISSFGAAVGDLFAAEGLEISAEAYRKSAGLSRETLGYTQENTRLKRLMADREIYKALGGQASDIAGAGLAASGSALDVMRDSAAQGELTRSLIDTQGRIDENAIRQQIVSYDAQAEAAENAAEGKLWSAGINALAGVVGIASFFAGAV